MLYKDDKCANDATRPSEGGPGEVGGLLASSLPLLDNAGCWKSQQQINAVGFVHWAQYLSLLPTRQDVTQDQ